MPASHSALLLLIAHPLSQLQDTILHFCQHRLSSFTRQTVLASLKHSFRTAILLAATVAAIGVPRVTFDVDVKSRIGAYLPSNLTAVNNQNSPGASLSHTLMRAGQPWLPSTLSAAVKLRPILWSRSAFRT